MNVKTYLLMAGVFGIMQPLKSQTIPQPSDIVVSKKDLPPATIGKMQIVSITQITPAVRRIAEKEIERNLNFQYDQVPEETFLFLAHYSNNIRRDNDVSGKISVNLADIQSTVLKNYEYVGYLPDGPTKEGPWTSIIRVFKREDGILITLKEFDFQASEGSVFIIKEAMNAKVGQLPAHFTRKRSPSGKVMSELSWVTQHKHMTLTVWDDVIPSGMNHREPTLSKQAMPPNRLKQQDLEAVAEGLA